MAYEDKSGETNTQKYLRRTDQVSEKNLIQRLDLSACLQKKTQSPSPFIKERKNLRETKAPLPQVSFKKEKVNETLTAIVAQHCKMNIFDKVHQNVWKPREAQFSPHIIKDKFRKQNNIHLSFCDNQDLHSRTLGKSFLFLEEFILLRRLAIGFPQVWSYR